ncbi:MAG: terminase [Rhodomicrobium sp.]
MKAEQDSEQALVDDITGFAQDPLGFVLYAFPWGEAGSELDEHTGPDEWQIGVLQCVGDGLLNIEEAIQIAIASGHGVGKSGLVAWLILWALSTHEDTRGVVTANTENQLRTKTWAEVAKWHRLFIAKHWFKLTATALFSVDPAHEKTWRIDAVAWSERNTEAFAGLHNQGKRILVVFDEASAIPDVIWETTEGALTDEDTEILWLVCGNPTRNTGRFRECFGRFRHRWDQIQVDSRTARLTNKEQIAQWIKDYGEDSDFVRVRVRGVFPRAGSMQFIAGDLVEEAMSKERDVDVTRYDPLVFGVDVARFGDDASVIAIRRGRDARMHEWLKFRGIDTMELSARIMDEARRLRPDAIFVDGGGVGGGVVDRLRSLNMNVIEVQFGGKPVRGSIAQDGAVVAANRRAEMWLHMRQWLEGGAIPDCPELSADLTGVEYGDTIKDGRDAIILERKEDMKRRGLASPDNGDALALTFAMPVEARDHANELTGRANYEYEYDPHKSMFQRQGSRGNPDDPYAHLRYKDRSQRFEGDYEPEWARKK